MSRALSLLSLSVIGSTALGCIDIPSWNLGGLAPRAVIKSETQWSFRFFDASGANQTRPQSINNLGIVSGHSTDVSGIEHGFIRSRTGEIKVVDVPGASATELLDVNDFGVAVGDYTDADGRVHGFRRAPGGAVTVVEPPGSTDAYLGGINDRGEAVGAQGLDSDLAFLVHRGTFLPIDPPPGADPQWTNPFGINNLGTVTGSYLDPDGNSHGFVLEDGEYRTVDSPLGGSTLNKSNDRGQAAGSYFPADGSPQQSFIVDLATLVQVPFNCPAGYVGTALRGINDLGQVTGFCLSRLPDGSIERHGFVAGPGQPEDQE